MTDPQRAERSPSTRTGARRASSRLVPLALGLAALVLAAWGFLGILRAFGSAPPVEVRAPETIAAAGPEAAAPERPLTGPPPARPARSPSDTATPERDAPAPDAELPPPVPEPLPVPEPSDAPSVPSGMGLFPPPGTVPLIRGIVVPESFELPEGFVRHYQATDSGEELVPILLLHPDYELLDDDGVAIELGPERVVPPELAPEGMPVELLELPANDGLPDTKP